MKPSLGRRVRCRGEDGFTLTEALLALIILGVAVVFGIMTAMGASIVASDVHRKTVTADSVAPVVRGAAQRRRLPGMRDPGGAANYSAGRRRASRSRRGYTASITNINYWNGDGSSSTPATFSTTCAAAPDFGVQQITIQVQSTDSRGDPADHDPQEAAVNGYWKRLIARLRCDSGVSLVELLIAISITAIITVPLVGAIYFGFRTTGDTQTRLVESGKAGLMSSFFVPDVAERGRRSRRTLSETAAACGTPRAAPVNLLITAADGSSVSYYRGSVACRARTRATSTGVRAFSGRHWRSP